MSVQHQQGPATEPQRRDERREVNREVIVTDSGNSSGSPVSTVIATVLGVAGLLFVVWLGMMLFGGNSQSQQQAPIEMPSEVNINVPDPAGDSGG